MSFLSFSYFPIQYLVCVSNLYLIEHQTNTIVFNTVLDYSSRNASITFSYASSPFHTLPTFFLIETLPFRLVRAPDVHWAGLGMMYLVNDDICCELNVG
jgi:hypothetical protein